MRPPTIATLVERIDVLAYHVGVLEAENAALRRATDILAQHLGHTIARADAQLERELRAAVPARWAAPPAPPPPKLLPAPTPIRRTDWSKLGPVTRRRIA